MILSVVSSFLDSVLKPCNYWYMMRYILRWGVDINTVLWNQRRTCVPGRKKFFSLAEPSRTVTNRELFIDILIGLALEQFGHLKGIMVYWYIEDNVLNYFH
jgi:hypothetical protein